MEHIQISTLRLDPNWLPAAGVPGRVVLSSLPAASPADELLRLQWNCFRSAAMIGLDALLLQALWQRVVAVGVLAVAVVSCHVTPSG